MRYAPSPKRKLAWTWEQAEVPGADGTPCWVGINTALPNRLIRATIEAGCLEEQLGAIAGIRAEVAYGENRRSRIDLLLTPNASAEDQRPIYLEVKNTTWSDGPLALFPDTVTERGQKHLQELMHVLPEARGAGALPEPTGCDGFRPRRQRRPALWGALSRSHGLRC